MNKRVVALVGRLAWLAAEGLRVVADELHLLSIRASEHVAPAVETADEIGMKVEPQDPLTPEAAELLHRESTRAGVEQHADEPEPVVIGRRVRRLGGEPSEVIYRDNK